MSMGCTRNAVCRSKSTFEKEGERVEYEGDGISADEDGLIRCTDVADEGDVRILHSVHPMVVIDNPLWNESVSARLSQ